MKVLLDTNILIRYLLPNVDQLGNVATAVEEIAASATLCVAPQVVYEFAAVCTRPREVNGLGLDWSTISEQLDQIRQSLHFSSAPERLMDTWADLCYKHSVKGKQVHDARLVAYMNCLAIDAIFTLNPADFKRYGVNVLSPELAS